MRISSVVLATLFSATICASAQTPPAYTPPPSCKATLQAPVITGPHMSQYAADRENSMATARLAFNCRDFEASYQLYLKVLDTYPNDARALSIAARAATLAGHPDAADSLNKRTLANGPRGSVRPIKDTAGSSCNCSPAPVGVNLNYNPQPYSAKQTSTRMQALADGTAIQQTTVTLLYRNSQGSTRSENMRSQNGDTTTFIQIYDYPTQTRYTWNVGPGALPTVTVYRPNRRAQQAPMAYTPQRYYPTRTESLPPQSIEGIYVTGEQTVRTTPANYEGNDRDIVVTTERWTAPALGLLVRSTIDDPRQGKTTIETTDIQQSEPDPSLFQPPAGYTLREANQ